MEIDRKLVNYVASYFYIKGLRKENSEFDAEEHEKTLKECLESYKKLLEDERKESPHHHTNRLD